MLDPCGTPLLGQINRNCEVDQGSSVDMGAWPNESLMVCRAEAETFRAAVFKVLLTRLTETFVADAETFRAAIFKALLTRLTGTFVAAGFQSSVMGVGAPAEQQRIFGNEAPTSVWVRPSVALKMRRRKAFRFHCEVQAWVRFMFQTDGVRGGRFPLKRSESFM